MTATVLGYGAYWDGPILWLVQGRGGSNFLGLKAACPFRASGGACNHLIPAAAPIPDNVHWEAFRTVINDPLVQAFLPLPEKRIVLVEDVSPHYLITLSRLSSPINSIVKPAWTYRPKDMEKELSTSNCQPLVLTQVDQKSSQLVDTLAKLAPYSPRPIILSGRPEVVAQQPIQRIKTNIENTPLELLMALPMENIGAMILRRYARKEPLDGITKLSSRQPGPHDGHTQVRDPG